MKIKLSYIQILRGFAALSVLLFHTDIDSQEYFNFQLFNFTYGYLGVDFFFVLSGFIITYNHLADIERRAGVKKFVIKRAIRIYPIYWLTLLAVVAITAPDFIDKPVLRETFTPFNWQGWKTILKNIFLTPQPLANMPVGVAWSLIYEIIFYIFFAFCIVLGWRYTKIFVAIWLAFILVNSRDLLPKNDWTNVIGGNLIMEFFAGCIVGYLIVKGKQASEKIIVTGLLMVAALLVAYLSWHPFNRASIAITSLLGSASALIIFYAVTIEKKYSSRKYSALVLVGDASYSIYLTHSLFSYLLCSTFVKLVNVSAFPPYAKVLSIILIVCLNVLLGIIVHLSLEKPMLNFFRKSFAVRSQTKGVATDS